MIVSNLISHNVDYGIYIYSGSHGNLIYNNSFYYNHGSGGTYNSSHVQAYDGGYNNYRTHGGKASLFKAGMNRRKSY